MPLGALGLALGAAVLHALWNLLLAGARDTQLATAAALTSGVVLLAPVALVVGGIPTRALPWIAASAALELTYFSLLAAAYAVGELSVTYPLARGLAPVFLVVVGVASGIGGAVSGVEVLGVAVVAIGIVAVRGLSARGGAREVVLAALIGACIAGYTLVDREGIQGARPLTYLWLVLALATPPYLAAMWRARGRSALRAAFSPTIVAAGLAIFGAYLLVLTALKLGASAASVGAVRECSVVIVTAFAAVFLHEHVGRARWAGAVLVTGGIVAIALG
jgi:drug/metabolite transporter (DMT)-like permease